MKVESFAVYSVTDRIIICHHLVFAVFLRPVLRATIQRLCHVISETRSPRLAGPRASRPVSSRTFPQGTVLPCVFGHRWTPLLRGSQVSSEFGLLRVFGHRWPLLLNLNLGIEKGQLDSRSHLGQLAGCFFLQF